MISFLYFGFHIIKKTIFSCHRPSHLTLLLLLFVLQVFVILQTFFYLFLPHFLHLGFLLIQVLEVSPLGVVRLDIVGLDFIIEGDVPFLLGFKVLLHHFPGEFGVVVGDGTKIHEKKNYKIYDMLFEIVISWKLGEDGQKYFNFLDYLWTFPYFLMEIMIFTIYYFTRLRLIFSMTLLLILAFLRFYYSPYRTMLNKPIFQHHC